jgi:hypothetical protein
MAFHTVERRARLVKSELIIAVPFELKETEPGALNGPQNVPLGSQEVER